MQYSVTDSVNYTIILLTINQTTLGEFDTHPIYIYLNMSPTIILLPDLLSPFPAPHALNPHYEVVGAESTRWMESFHVFNPKAQAVFNTHDFALMTSRFYPHVNREHFRLACDINNWFFVYDAVSDDESVDLVKETADTLIKLLE